MHNIDSVHLYSKDQWSNQMTEVSPSRERITHYTDRSQLSRNWKCMHWLMIICQKKLVNKINKPSGNTFHNCVKHDINSNSPPLPGIGRVGFWVSHLLPVQHRATHSTTFHFWPSSRKPLIAAQAVFSSKKKERKITKISINLLAYYHEMPRSDWLRYPLSILW